MSENVTMLARRRFHREAVNVTTKPMSRRLNADVPALRPADVTQIESGRPSVHRKPTLYPVCDVNLRGIDFASGQHR